jgi:hypothetical protein
VAYPGVGGVLLHGCGVRMYYEKSVLSYSFVLEATKHFLVLALGYCTSRSECSAVSVYDLILVGRHIVSAATALKTPRCAFRVLFQLAHCWMASSLLSKRARILDVSHDGSSIHKKYMFCGQRLANASNLGSHSNRIGSRFR